MATLALSFFSRSAPRLPRVTSIPSFEVADLLAEVRGMAHPVQFGLFIRDGLVAVLEGTTYDEPLPENVTDCRIRYEDVPRTNWVLHTRGRHKDALS